MKIMHFVCKNKKYNFLELQVIDRGMQGVRTDGVRDDVYLPAAICFMRFRALPALNQPICCSLSVWLSLILSVLPFSCLISQSTGLPGVSLAKPKMEILSVGVICEANAN